MWWRSDVGREQLEEERRLREEENRRRKEEAEKEKIRQKEEEEIRKKRADQQMEREKRLEVRWGLPGADHVEIFESVGRKA